MLKLRYVAAAMLSVVLAVMTTNADTVTVTIDKSQTFQTIDGNGFMGTVKPWKVRQGPFWVDADITNFLDSLINVMGVTLHRWFVNNGCGLSSVPGEFTITDRMRAFFEQAQYLDSVAKARNEWYGVCPTILGPPAYMKVNNKCAPDDLRNWPENPYNTLKEDQYDDFGEFCATFLRTAVDTFGVVPYAFSFQNEPHFNVAYTCCTYANGVHYASMLKGAAPAVRALGLPTLIFGTEVGGDLYRNWAMAIHYDPEASPYLDIDALHGYGGNGIDVPSPTTYRNIHPLGERRLWVSETAHRIEQTDTHDKALDMVGRCFAYAYGQGNISAWIQVGLCANEPGSTYPGGFVFKDNGQPAPAYWLACQFWRFIRPGMQRIQAQCSQDSLFVLAFKDDRVSSMSTILMNVDTVAHTVRLDISGGDAPPRFDMKRTTEIEKFVLLGTVAPNEMIEVPARSVVSLGYNYIGTGVPPGNGTKVMRSSARPVGHAPLRHGTSIFDLRGRLVSRGATLTAAARRAVSAAAYCVESRDGRSLMIVRQR